jgi:hypothetical protein
LFHIAIKLIGVKRMATLISCIECGQKLSSAAGKCPHCKAQYAQGRRCEICTKTGRFSNGKHAREDESDIWMHEECYEEIQREFHGVRYTCPVCKHTESCTVKKEPWSNFLYPAFTNPCPKCGHPLDWHYRATRCKYCRTWVLPIRASNYSEQYAHKKCLQSWAKYNAINTKPSQVSDSQANNKAGCSQMILLLFTVVLFLIYAQSNNSFNPTPRQHDFQDASSEVN